MKVHLQPQELWPFYDLSKADTELEYAVEMPTKLFEDYVRIKSDFIEISDKVADIDRQYRDAFYASKDNSKSNQIVSTESKG